MRFRPLLPIITIIGIVLPAVGESTELSCDQVAAIPTSEALEAIEDAVVDRGVVHCLQEREAERWRVVWAIRHVREPEQPSRPRQLEDASRPEQSGSTPPRREGDVFLRCQRSATKVETESDGEMTATETTLVRHILFNEEAGTLFYRDGYGIDKAYGDWAMAAEVSFHHEKIFAEFDRGQVNRVFAGIATLGLSELAAGGRVRGVLDRVAGTWSMSDHKLECAVMEMRERQF